MKRARVVYESVVREAREQGDKLLLDDGRVVGEGQVRWLPPVEAPGAIFALGLNYAAHAKELAFKAPTDPLIFLKSATSLIGHRQHTLRPHGLQFLNHECELAVVIGKTARRVRADEAMDFVAGFTVANDYAFRDYLENYYRPNLRVKSRTHATPLGPWLVDRDDVPDPMNLTLRTMVNGKVTQEGSTRDMIFSPAALIEYLSGFMMLSPGDLILTGTPEGLADCKAGDVVVTEIEGVGRLQNTIMEFAPPPP